MKFKVNPYYISVLLGPLALAVASEDSDLLNSVDYSSDEQRKMVIELLIRPEFERLKESPRLEVARALAYFSSSSKVSAVIEQKLLLCEIPPGCHHQFIESLWNSLFPEETAANVAEGVGGVVNRPLTANDVTFAYKADYSLSDLVDGLRLRLQIN